MLRTNFAKFALILGLAFAAQNAAASVTYIVGTCKGGTRFSTISAALAASPSPDAVQVCPGTYPEQINAEIVVTKLTIEGIASDNSDQIIIVPPSSGLAVNATDDMGNPVAAQLFLTTPSGVGPSTAFEIKDLTIDGTANGIGSSPGGPTYIAGVFVQNASGTIEGVTTRNQMGNGYGVGVWVEGGALNSTVTVENNSIHDFDFTGIWNENNSTSGGGGLTVTDTDNYVSLNGIIVQGAPVVQGGIVIQGNVDATVKKNVGAWGGPTMLPTLIYAGSGASGSLTNNSVILTGGGTGILAGSGSLTLLNNTVIGGSTGILLMSNPTLQGNLIVSGAIGIEFNCIVDDVVSSNTIIDGATGLDQVPSGITSPNTYYDVATQKTTCSTAP
jgi:hypothetical protein